MAKQTGRRFLFRFRSRNALQVLNGRGLPGLLFGTRETQDLLRWMSYCFLVGVVAGLGALVFAQMLDQTNHLLLGEIAGYRPPAPGGEGKSVLPVQTDPHNWLLILIPAVGGLLSGLLVFSVAPEAEGHGTDAVIDAFHNKRGQIRSTVPLVKIAASALTIGSGGSAGREGPIAQVGAGFASLLGRYLKLTPTETRELVIVGAGAGIGAIFRAPLGGALFAASVLYRETDYEHAALMPGFLASVTAYAIYSVLSGTPYGPIFTIEQDFTFTLGHLPFYFLLGLLMVPLSMAYIWVFYGLRDKVFKRLPLPPHVVPAIGGLGLGLIAWEFPEVLGIGYGWIQQALEGQLTIKFMITLALLKIFATGLTIGSGGSGGVFAPSMVIGGLSGGALGMWLHQMRPDWFGDPAAFVLVGMAAFFAAAAKTPIASLVLVSEMTESYVLLVPAMFAIAVAYMFSGTRWSIYEKQVRNRFTSPAHRGVYVVDVLEEIPVRDVLRADGQIARAHPETTLAELYGLIAKTSQSVFPVVDEDDRFVGCVSINLLREVPPNDETADLIIAEDLMEKSASIKPDDTLNTALEAFLRSGTDELPVVNEEGRFVGLLTRRDLLAAYYTRLKELRAD